MTLKELIEALRGIEAKYGSNHPVSICVELKDGDSIRVQRQEPIGGVSSVLRYSNGESLGKCIEVVLTGKSFDDV